MKDHEFNLYLRNNLPVAWAYGDPEAGFSGNRVHFYHLPYDGVERAGIGSSRQLRGLAQQLLLCADEIDRRKYEDV